MDPFYDFTLSEGGIRLGHVLAPDSGKFIRLTGLEDRNRDGIPDGNAGLVVAVEDADDESEEDVGHIYVEPSLPTDGSDLDLDDVPAGTTVILGVDVGDSLGRSLALCDFDGDGILDIVGAAPLADPHGDGDNPVNPGAGVVYLFQTEHLSPGEISADAVPFVVTINGANTFDNAGWSICAGDFNGDGNEDVLIGAPGVDTNGSNSGTVYVLWGTDEPLPVTIDLDNLDPSLGGSFVGLAAGDRLGWSVANLGDINGDGIDDCAMSAPNADPGGETSAGQCWVIFGTESNIFDNGSSQKPGALALATTPVTFDLSTLDGSNGFTIIGADGSNYAGRSIASAGDINGDGFNDIIIGADGVDLDGEYGFFSHGAAYVVFGTDAGFDAVIDLGELDGTNGFRLHGASNDGTSQTGYSVSSAGDFNGDGFDDLVIGALRSHPTFGQPPFGAVYVVFGSATPFAADFDLTTLDGQNGFRINGAEALDYVGTTVVGLGDVDGDGYDDIAVNGFGVDVAYIVYGQATNPGPIAGGAGDDTLTGTSGSDLFDLSLGGNDTVSGGGHDDGFYFGGAFTELDLVDGGDGTLDQVGLQGDYSGGLTFGAGNFLNVEMLVLLPGNDSRFGDTAGNLYSYNLTTIDANVAAGQTFYVSFNELRAGENVTFDGSAETDGAFVTYAGHGVETLTGGAGDDGFYFGEGRFGAGEVLNGGAGSLDQLGLQGNHTIVFGAGQLNSIEMIVCLTASDARFNGNAAALYSYDLTMDDGNVGTGGVLYISANQLIAGEILTFDGSAETDGGRFVVYGGDGDDTITGSAGADELHGRGGADDLRGGAGDDTFVYLAATDSTAASTDELLDFANGDRIDVSAVSSFSFIGSAAFTGSAGQLRAYEQAGLWHVEGDTDGDSVADLVIAVTSDHALAAGDFLL